MARPMHDMATRRTTPSDMPRTYPLGRQHRFGFVQAEFLLSGAAVLAMAFTIVAGTIGAAIFIACALALFALRPTESVRDLVRFSPLLALSLLAMLSTIWSDAPERTLRAGLQLSLTVIAAIVICRRMSGSALIAFVFLAYLVICLGSLPELPAALSRNRALAGLFESKNQLGFAAHLLFALSLAIIVDRRQYTALRIGAIATIPLCILFVILSDSAGAKASMAITFVVFPALIFLGRVNLSFRAAIIAGTLSLVVVALIFLPDLMAAWSDFRVTVLKKDATLTGRTYLWDFAARLSAERPLLGHGYYAFWRVGNIDAEGLWRWGGIGSRSGFNFHNAFVEMRVDLGWIGELVFIASCAAIALVGLARQLLRPNITMAFLLSLLTVLYIRCYTESGLIGPFNLLTLLWIATAVYASSKRTADENDASPRRRARNSGLRQRSLL